MSVIIVKFPTRERPEKFFSTLEKYRTLESGRHTVRYVITCDADDATMNNPAVIARLDGCDRLRYRFGKSASKIEACNADMDLAGDGWDILVLASDDMIPHVNGWDDVIAHHMQGKDAIWLYDGYAKSVCTLSIMSRAVYLKQGYIYNPEYKSFACDNEWTWVMGLKRIDQVIIRHIHGMHGRGPVDNLYKKNAAHIQHDRELYERRRKEGFPGPLVPNPKPYRAAPPPTPAHRRVELRDKRARKKV